MRRLALLLVVGLLTATTGGVLEFVQPEPCTASESSSTPYDSKCPPTCLRCHCARAFDVVAPAAASALPFVRPDFAPPPAAPTLVPPDDILHVPRPARG